MAHPHQVPGERDPPQLCPDCRDLDLLQFYLNGIPVQLCLDKEILMTGINSMTEQQKLVWDKFLSHLLKRVCAACNTPNILDSPNSPVSRRACWVLLIHIKSASTANSYNNFLSEKITDKLKPMLMGPDFSENFFFDLILDDRAQWIVCVHILGTVNCLVAKDFRSPQSLDHCLLDVNLDCIVHHLFCQTDVECHMPTRPQGLEGKSNGEEVPVPESGSIEFKSPQQGNPHRAVSEYINWLWREMPQPLGKYITAFAKTHHGGAFYFGVRENRGTYTIHALELSLKGKHEMKEALQKKIKEDMLWVQRDPKSDQGYAVLRPRDIKKGTHFDVEFILVNDPSRRFQNLYILEVKVAPFDGVVFNYGGPEVYVFQKKEEKGRDVYHLKQVAARVWLEKLQQYAWCSKHRRQRQLCCGHYDRCNTCKKANIQPDCCKEVKICCGPCKAAHPFRPAMNQP